MNPPSPVDPESFRIARDLRFTYQRVHDFLKRAAEAGMPLEDAEDHLRAFDLAGGPVHYEVIDEYQRSQRK